MSLRRQVHANNAGMTTPRRVLADVNTNTPTTPRSPLYGNSSPMGHIGSPFTTPSPSRAKVQMQVPPSPFNSESLSATRPFDWDAVRQHRPPPYGSPMSSARRKARLSEMRSDSDTRRAVRKKTWREKIMSIPNRILFEISLFPHNIPTPESKKSAWIIGGMMHFIHLCIRLSQYRNALDEDLPWATESRVSAWFDWTMPLTALLFCTSVFVAFRLFSSIRLYNLHLRRELVNSPSAEFVSTELDFTPLEAPSLAWRLFSWFRYHFSVSWRFLLNFKPPARHSSPGARVERVQQLRVWSPGELELHLCAVYSPAHALLWTVTNGANWIVMFAIMAAVGLQTNLLTNKYERLIKDKAIISAEVMHEYDEKFVNPRVNPVREDKCVMTHQAEVIDLWKY